MKEIERTIEKKRRERERESLRIVENKRERERV